MSSFLNHCKGQMIRLQAEFPATASSCQNHLTSGIFLASNIDASRLSSPPILNPVTNPSLTRVQVIQLKLHPKSQLQGHVGNVILNCTASVHQEDTPEGVGTGRASQSPQFAMKDNSASLTGFLQGVVVVKMFPLNKHQLSLSSIPCALTLGPKDTESSPTTPDTFQCPVAGTCFQQTTPPV